MSRGKSSSRTDAWNEGLASVGRAEIKTDMSQVNWWYLLPTVVIFGVMFIAGNRQVEDFYWVIVLFIVVIALIIGLVYWVTYRHRNKTLVVERDSLTLLNGFRLYWQEIERVALRSGGKSGPGIVIEVNERAWERYLNQQSFGARLNSRLNKTVLRRRLIYLAAIFGDNPNELATWLNGFTATGREARETEKY